MEIIENKFEMDMLELIIYIFFLFFCGIFFFFMIRIFILGVYKYLLNTLGDQYYLR